MTAVFGTAATRVRGAPRPVCLHEAFKASVSFVHANGRSTRISSQEKHQQPQQRSGRFSSAKDIQAAGSAVQDLASLCEPAAVAGHQQVNTTTAHLPSIGEPAPAVLSASIAGTRVLSKTSTLPRSYYSRSTAAIVADRRRPSYTSKRYPRSPISSSSMRCFASGTTGATGGRKDGEQSVRTASEQGFDVTGTLLDARRAGADSPLPGQYLALSHAFGPEAVAAFAAHAGDNNPIHLDEEYARSSGSRKYDGCIVHGLMVAGLFSTAFGRAISGALYVSQSLRFERPVLVGEMVDARVEVERARVTSSGREVLVRCSTVASLADGTVAVSGQAKVLLPRSCEVRSW